ncbi:non-hydrolyzing UDP-N-acetylglucosamine 2-epimerase [Succinimonas sp.]|uniref:non-hydrolyzing UDP-N-acetylglucosamine 2-epimerase n=1 Tax=Succinimonas sp. TaxID=1936151 RepID=UPI003869D267
MRPKVIIIAGTRPEAIKMAPVVMEFRKHPEFITLLCNSGQHREMINETFRDFALVPDFSLDVMTPGQSLAMLSSRLFSGIDALLEKEKPDWVLVQGDTTTVMVSALCAFYRRIRVGHIEAGLRTFDKHAPFPEEINRQMVSRVADLHFAPTRYAYANLIREGIDPDTAFVTGNTVIDALLWVQDYLKDKPEYLHSDIRKALEENKRIILVTGHRRENFGHHLEDICKAVRRLADDYKDCLFVFPEHLNPNVRVPVNRILSNHERVLLLQPQSYLHFHSILGVSYLVLTDSGGIQEEAPALGKPVLVMREVTERPEGIKTGCARLLGTDADRIYDGVALLLDDPVEYAKMSRAQNPYGHGHSAERICDAVMRASGLIVDRKETAEKLK